MQKKTLESSSREIPIGVPEETLESLQKVADRRDLPLKALLKLYVGQGLKNDLSQAESAELAMKRFKSRKTESIEVDLAA